MPRNQTLFKRANRVLPGGVNSPVRAFQAVGGHPFFVKRGKGAVIWDEEGNRYLDYVLSWGPLLLGHAHPKVVHSIGKAIRSGTSFGACHANEIRLAELLRTFFPIMEKSRLVSSGTEAVMSAVRLARGVTGRDLIVKFEGCYHGHGDSFLVKAGSGGATFGQPTSKGVPASLAKLTITLPFNDPSLLQKIFKAKGKQIACVVMEPVAGNMGVIPPLPGFLKETRRLTRQKGSLLIFDEVMTGFRAALKGAQSLFGVQPDITCLGKVIGGGMPLAAFGGRAKIMNALSPLGNVYQAGTLSGNPAAVAAGVTTLELLKKNPSLFQKAERLAYQLERGIRKIIEDRGLSWQFHRVGTMWTLFFTSKPVKNFQDVQTSDLKLFSKFFRYLLKQGIYITPSAFEANFLSCAHTSLDIQRTLGAISKFAGSIRK